MQTLDTRARGLSVGQLCNVRTQTASNMPPAAWRAYFMRNSGPGFDTVKECQFSRNSIAEVKRARSDQWGLTRYMPGKLVARQRRAFSCEVLGIDFELTDNITYADQFEPLFLGGYLWS